MSGKKISQAFWQQKFKTKKEWRELIEEIIGKTGFKPESNFFANVVYHQDKIGAVHFTGQWRNKPVL